MAAERAHLVALAYRRQLAALRVTLEARIQALYGSVSAEDLDATYAAFAAAAAPMIAAGQASAVAFSAAYLRSLFAVQAGRTIEPAPPPDGLVGLTELGLPLTEGMAAIPSMVKAEIGAGRVPAEAIAFGLYLSSRFVDSEVVRVADATTESIATRTPEVRGWRGTVSARACDGCRANGGEHPASQPMYRHGGCGCSREWIAA